MTKFVIQYTTPENYAKVLGGGFGNSYNETIIEAETKEEALAKAESIYNNYVIIPIVKSVEEIEAKKKAFEDKLKRQKEEEEKAKIAKEEKEKAKAEEMGLTFEDYKKYKKSKSR